MKAITMNKMGLPALYAYLIICCSCSNIIFVPVKGSINGYVTDNNGAVLGGIEVVASFIAPSQSEGQPSSLTTVTATTDSNGYYELADLWDDVTITVDQLRFTFFSQFVHLDADNHPRVDIPLSGSPTITRTSLSKEKLSFGQPDTLIARMEVNDRYNTTPDGYSGNLLLIDDDATAAIYSVTLISQGLENYLFEAMITSNDLPRGILTVVAEVKDPDGNTHALSVGTLLVE